MLYRDESGDVVRLNVIGPGGETIGGVEALYVDEETNEAEFALIGMGLFRLRHSYVPLVDSRTEGDALHVPYAKDMVKDAPDVEPGERLDRADLSAVYRHYGIDPDARDVETSAPAPPSPPDPLGEERSDEGSAVASGAQKAAAPNPVAPGPTGVLGDQGSHRMHEPVGAASADTGNGSEPERDVEQPPLPDASVPREDTAPGGHAADDTETSREETSLDDRTVDELRRLAADRDIPGRSSMNKRELVNALGGGETGEGTAASAEAYEDRTVDELRRLAADRDIPGRSSMNKGALIEALRRH